MTFGVGPASTARARPNSMREVMVVVLAMLSLAAACGTDRDEEADRSTTTTARGGTTTAGGATTTGGGGGSTTTVPADEGLDPVGPTSTDTVEGGGFPSLEGDTALLVDIRAAPHDGFERIVFEFEGSNPPGYRVGYLDPPIRQDGSGNPVEVAGRRSSGCGPCLPQDTTR